MKSHTGPRPPKSNWRSSPLSPFDNDLRKPWQIRDVRPPQTSRVNTRAYNVDEFDDEDMDYIFGADSVAPGPTSREDPSKQRDSRLYASPSSGGLSEPGSDSPSGSSDVKLEEDASATEAVPSSVKIEERESSVSTPGRGPISRSSDSTYSKPSGLTGFAHLRPGKPSAPVEVSAVPMEREGSERGRAGLSLRSYDDLTTTPDQQVGLDQLDPLHRPLIPPDTPRLLPIDLDESDSRSSTWATAAEPARQLEPQTPTAEDFHSHRHSGSKRPASEISDEEPSASHIETAGGPEMRPDLQPTHATTSKVKDIPGLSDSFRVTDIQQEIYKIYSMLRQLVRVATKRFSVVDPQAFIETLSWCHLQPSQAQSIAVVRRLRSDIVSENGRKMILIPFQYDYDIFLALVQLSARPRRLRVYDPEMVSQTDGPELTYFQNDWPPGLCVMHFVRILFPEEPVARQEWLRTREITSFGPEPLVESELVAGRYYNDIGTPHSLPYVLPFFLEMLHILVDIEPPDKVCHDLALMKRLFAAFEGNQERHTVMEDLRQDCRRDMSALFGSNIQRARWEVIKEVPKVLKGRGLSKSKTPSTTSLRRRARINTEGIVAKVQKVASEFVEEYHHLSLLISALDAMVLRNRADLQFSMARVVFAVLEKVPVKKAEAWSLHWAQVRATNAWMYSSLEELGSKLGEMQRCLDEWKADYLEALNEVSGQEITVQDSKPQGIISHFKLEHDHQRETRRTLSHLKLDQGDLREAQRSLAVRRSLEPHSGQQRLEAARQRFRLGRLARLFTQS